MWSCYYYYSVATVAVGEDGERRHRGAAVCSTSCYCLLLQHRRRGRVSTHRDSPSSLQGDLDGETLRPDSPHLLKDQSVSPILWEMAAVPSGSPTSMPTPSPSPKPATYWVIYSLAYGGPPTEAAVIYNWAMIAFGGFILVHRYSVLKVHPF